MGTLHEPLSRKVRSCSFFFFFFFFFYFFFFFCKKPIGEDGLPPVNSGFPIPRRDGVRRSAGDLRCRARETLLRRLCREIQKWWGRRTNHVYDATLLRGRFLQTRSSAWEHYQGRKILFMQKKFWRLLRGYGQWEKNDYWRRGA